jgi:glycosyltransferase involved in cell wall biosynthesis
MACGKPIVASRAGGAVELIEPGVNALAHEPGNVSALAQCLAELVRNAELRDRLSRAALHSRERFARSRLARELAPIYESLVPA